MGKRIALAAEAAAHRSRDDADAARGKFQHLGQGAMEIVRRLGRRPNGELIVRAVETHGAVLLHRQMSIALVEKGALENMIRVSESVFDVAEFERHCFLNIGVAVPGMNPLALLGRRQRFFDGENRFQHFIFDIDVAQRFFGEALADGRHRGDGVADVTRLCR